MEIFHTDDEAPCPRCRTVYRRSELDRLLWCDACVRRARSRCAGHGWLAGGFVAVGLSAWIWMVIRPSQLLLGGWVGVTIAGFYLAARLVREVTYGVERYRNVEGVEAGDPPG